MPHALPGVAGRPSGYARMMLTVTRNAAAALVDSRDRQGIAPDASLRIAAAQSHSDDLAHDDVTADDAGITIAFVDEPIAGDQVGTVHGLTICVAADVADSLTDAAIDVEEEPGGGARLVLVESR